MACHWPAVSCWRAESHLVELSPQVWAQCLALEGHTDTHVDPKQLAGHLQRLPQCLSSGGLAPAFTIHWRHISFSSPAGVPLGHPPRLGVLLCLLYPPVQPAGCRGQLAVWPGV